MSSSPFVGEGHGDNPSREAGESGPAAQDQVCLPDGSRHNSDPQPPSSLASSSDHLLPVKAPMRSCTIPDCKRLIGSASNDPILYVLLAVMVSVLWITDVTSIVEAIAGAPSFFNTKLGA
ncbi:hypothetical protein E2C01_040090 [Portunus trituberculatus]|uniref:Uncharacterized protein n=1 Tax=Portunus trituberculatus TaxID=210409 RepID=A0A5B7FGG4_PORTR|nr:hypothetical protein [Portunus trituberculatus]